MKIQISLLFLCTLLISSISNSLVKNIPSMIANKNALIESQYQRSVGLLLKNLSPSDGSRGAIIAAPSKAHPDYYYHWVRDAALVTDCLISLYLESSDGNLKTYIRRFLMDYLNFNIVIQASASQFGGLGEPKFYVNGASFTGPWGRPQNDGPALRSTVNIKILGLASKENWPEIINMLPVIYDASLSKPSLIKSDLEHVAHNWTNPNFDLWEEVNGYHFYTFMAQRKSLYYGSYLAGKLNDPGAAQFYQNEARKIDSRLEAFWNPNVNYILASFGTLNTNSGKFLMSSKSQLDTAILLGVLHSDLGKVSYSIPDPRVFSTYLVLKNTFNSIYTINGVASLNTAIGRYPEDTYDGYVTTSRGNPWVLTTAAAAEYLYMLANEYLNSQKIVINFANQRYFSQVLKISLKEGQVIGLRQEEFKNIILHLLNEADLYMLRILFHANPDGSLSEQINRETGFMQGAPNLTWSHASFITAKLKRDLVFKTFRIINR